MKLIVPKYYTDFKCVGGSCSDNCCIGWEIDIDEQTKKKYFSLEGPLGDRIRKNTVTEDGVCHFLMQGERCPFLNSENLCDIICAMGEEGLCEICHEHPRFYTVLGDTVYGGVGLSCEEAARLILTNHEPAMYVALDTECDSEECDGELYGIFLSLRKEIAEIFKNGTQSIVCIKKAVSDAVKAAQSMADASMEIPYETKEFTHKDLVENVEKCELLTEELPTLLKRISARKTRKFKNDDINNYLQNIFLYFLERYLPKAVEDGDFFDKLTLAIFSTEVIEALFATEDDLTLQRAIYLCKLYSKEIEYNEENVLIIESI